MFRIEYRQESTGAKATRWVPVSPEAFKTQQEADRALREHMRREMARVAHEEMPWLPRYRVPV